MIKRKRYQIPILILILFSGLQAISCQFITDLFSRGPNGHIFSQFEGMMNMNGGQFQLRGVIRFNLTFVMN